MMKHSRGYTLLEMIVSIGVFSIVMLTATGAYLSLIRLDRQTRAVNDIVTSLSFAIDTMSREIRTGAYYKCNNSQATPNCTGTPGTSFGFVDSRTPARSVVYLLENGQIYARITSGGVTTESAFTDPRVTIESLRFFVRGVGTSTGDGTALIQPQSVFSVRGTIQTDTGRALTFTVQSSATQRFLELP